MAKRRPKPTYIAVKYDIFPYCLIPKLECMDGDKYRVKDIGLYKHSSVLCVLPEAKALKLKATLGDMVRLQREANVSMKQAAREAIEKAAKE